MKHTKHKKIHRTIHRHNPIKHKFAVFAIGAVAILTLGFVGLGTYDTFTPDHAKTFGINNWWPLDGARIEGQQPFRGIVDGLKTDDYKMYWYVDEAQWNEMPTNDENLPHKHTIVDVNSLAAAPGTPQAVTYVATDLEGNELARKTINIYIQPVIDENPTPGEDPATSPEAEAREDTAADPGEGEGAASPGIFTVSDELYVEPFYNAESAIKEWQASRPEDAKLLEALAKQPRAKWLGDWSGNVEHAVNMYVSAAASANKLPVLVAYNIPLRHCEGGGAANADAYRSWIQSFAKGLKGRRSLVIVEPDAMALLDCLGGSDRTERISLIKEAVQTLKAQPNVQVYIDAGHPKWVGTDEMASRLKSVAIDQADGFSLNVANFIKTDENLTYGNALSDQVGGKKFVVDTSRNGLGPSPSVEWCNPLGRAVGPRPTLKTGHAKAAAYLWVKVPGESDGTCNGGPNAGAFWAEYAFGLMSRAQ